MTDYISTREAAEIIGCTQRRIVQLLESRELVGRMLHPKAWMVDVNSAKKRAELVAAAR